MINCGIYQWTNKITGKIYIGQSCNLIKRKKLFSNFKSYHYAGKLINEERKKYPSLKYWDYEVLEECNIKDLKEMEEKYIKEVPLDKSLNFEYNIGKYNKYIFLNKERKLNQYNFSYLLDKKVKQYCRKQSKWYLRHLIRIINDKKCIILYKNVVDNNFLTENIVLKIPECYNNTDLYFLISYINNTDWTLCFKGKLIDYTVCKIVSENIVSINSTFYDIAKKLKKYYYI